MAGKIRTEVRPRLQVKPLAKVLVRAQAAGEIVAAMGGTEKAVRCVQEGFARALLRQVLIYGVQPTTDQYQEKMTFTLLDPADSNDTVLIEDDETKSMVERLDQGLAEAVRRKAARFTRLGLTTQVRVHLVEEIERDPVRKAAAYAELELTDVPAIPPADDSDIRHVASITPGKDKNTGFDFYRGKKRS